jgi:hypothetical protein
MHKGTVMFNGVDFSGLGKPKLSISRQADPPAPAFPTRWAVSLTVSVALEAMDPGTIQARVRRLQASLNVPDGILTSASGSGHAVEWLAVPTRDNLTEAMTGKTNTLEMAFSAWENHPNASIESLISAAFTPSGSGVPITLHALREVREEVRTDRHSDRNAARKLTTTSLTFTARVMQTNPADPMATRLAALQAKVAEIKSLDCRDGLLVIGNNEHLVRVQDFSPVIDEQRGALDVRVQCFHSTLPNADIAELAYDLRSRQDEGTGEQVTTASGAIEASTRTIAVAKLDALRSALTTAGRRTVSFERTDKAVEGFDTSESNDDWMGGLAFALEFREPIEGNNYTLKIASRRDLRTGMKWTYSGTVRAADSNTALTRARSLVAPGTHPVQTTSEETLSQATDLDAERTLRFTQLDFSYEYEGPATGFIGGEIIHDQQTPRFGEWRTITSGNLVADTKENAEAALAAFIGSTAASSLETSKRWSEVYLKEGTNDPTLTFQRLDFSYNVRSAHTDVAIKYTDVIAPDLTAMTETRSIAGTLYATSEAAAETAFATLLTNVFGSRVPQKVQKSHHRESQTVGTVTTSAWVQLDFSAECISNITGSVGYDLIEASFTLERVGSLNQNIITHIPFDRPVAQINTGWLPGTLTVNATAKARTQTVARDWCQGKRSYATSVGSERYESAQPREVMGYDYGPFPTGTARFHTFSGTYSWAFTDSSLDGLWGTGIG